ncbi:MULTISPECIES: conjugal transfer protein VirC2 [Rhizobium/Agrobacterium group]|uniref:VirC2 n=1 Tax=Agrobacterium tumefaciens TaxID=358 RepID=Q8VT90_AGRTU|nr:MULTISPECIES: conjugal transfer protein VirC2 [Rhizobium/Agrobacterium group]AAL57021.1 VirC2 [Agrobacterium tumefaciens]MBO9112507.1 conjugal transfer protein VirC2 [Agrobacterium sp. S2/73]QXZ76013.1 conjugal transfer protein VirC2 [Agrobacterium sp. S7/73]QYA16976.1 conjugal transfer protein VirC2 [Rhizobium sp. AB2/73]UEQ85451.1 conjugal transfer protein VirC2 [Rhizobium sp. AB2/73]
MGIRKPALSVVEAKRLAAARPEIVHPISTRSSRDPAPNPEIGGREDRSPPSVAAKRRDSFDRQSMLTVDALSSAAPPEKIQVFLSARPPAPEVSKMYDTLVLQYSDSKSLQMILRRALADFEAMLADGSFSTAPKTYPISQVVGKPVIVQTSRMFPVPLLEVARNHFDPLRLESARAFGHKLATAALASFFAGEKMTKGR